MADLPVVFISCRVFETLLSRYLPTQMAGQVMYMDYGLHSNPKHLHNTLQSAIDAIAEPSLIVLAYGMCGNGLKGIRSGIHTLLMPKTEDCIAVFLGSDQAYREEFGTHPGTYYLTSGWLEAGSNPLQEYEKAKKKFGEETACWVMDQQYQHYNRLVLVSYSEADLQKYREQALTGGRVLQTLGYGLSGTTRYGCLHPAIGGSCRRSVEGGWHLPDCSACRDH